VLDPGRSGKTANIPEHRGIRGGLVSSSWTKLADHWGTAHRGDGHELWAELASENGAPPANGAWQLN